QREYPQFTLIEPTIDEQKETLTLYYPPIEKSIALPLNITPELAKKCPVMDTFIWEEYPKSHDLSAICPEITEFLQSVTKSDTNMTIVSPHVRRRVIYGFTSAHAKIVNRKDPES